MDNYFFFYYYFIINDIFILGIFIFFLSLNPSFYYTYLYINFLNYYRRCYNYESYGNDINISNLPFSSFFSFHMYKFGFINSICLKCYNSNIIS